MRGGAHRRPERNALRLDKRARSPGHRRIGTRRSARAAGLPCSDGRIATRLPHPQLPPVPRRRYRRPVRHPRSALRARGDARRDEHRPRLHRALREPLDAPGHHDDAERDLAARLDEPDARARLPHRARWRDGALHRIRPARSGRRDRREADAGLVRPRRPRDRDDRAPEGRGRDVRAPPLPGLVQLWDVRQLAAQPARPARPVRRQVLTFVIHQRLHRSGPSRPAGQSARRLQQSCRSNRRRTVAPARQTEAIPRPTPPVHAAPLVHETPPVPPTPAHRREPSPTVLPCTRPSSHASTSRPRSCPCSRPSRSR